MPVHRHHQGMKMTVRAACPLSIFTAGHLASYVAMRPADGVDLLSHFPFLSRRPGIAEPPVRKVLSTASKAQQVEPPLIRGESRGAFSLWVRLPLNVGAEVL